MWQVGVAPPHVRQLEPQWAGSESVQVTQVPASQTAPTPQSAATAHWTHAPLTHLVPPPQGLQEAPHATLVLHGTHVPPRHWEPVPHEPPEHWQAPPEQVGVAPLQTVQSGPQ